MHVDAGTNFRRRRAFIQQNSAKQNRVANFSTYFHTVRHLRPVQVYSRVKLRLVNPRADLRPAPPLRSRPRTWHTPALHARSMTGPRQFQFLNVTAELADDGAWQHQNDTAGIDRLWLYNLHYFADLAAADAPQRRAWHTTLIHDWISANPPGRGVGWEPYPLSRRVANWVHWSWGGGALDEAATHSLAVQVRYLTRRLEYHLLGNHLLANAKALVLGGLYFAGPEADAWLRRGLALFAEQLPEQILADGGHYERSTMYHAVVLEDLLDVYQALSAHRDSLPIEGRQALEAWPALLDKMRRWLWTMTHPDGDIGLFNDAAFGIAATPAQLDAYAGQLDLAAAQKPGPGVTRLDASGYIRVEQGPAVALLDVAPLGPDFLPGHAHADTLSFEMSLFGQRFIVHSGTSTYREGSQREYERSTAAHNTVEIDGQSSSEMWGAFRVARRAHAKSIEVSPLEGGWSVSAEHDGYRRLTRGAALTRHWAFFNHQLNISDDANKRVGTAIARFHLHPDVEFIGTTPVQKSIAESPMNDYEHCFRVAGRTVCWGGANGVASIVASEYHPQFGATVPNLCLEFRPTCAKTGIWLEWDEP